MALHDKDLQRLQAMMMIHMKVHGMGNNEIAQELNIHKDTVERRLAFARKADLFVEYESQLIEKLIPKAIKAIETALEDGDAETGLEILKALNVIRDTKAPKTPEQTNADNDLMKAIQEARENRVKLEGTVEGEIRELGRTNLAGLLQESNEAGTHTGTSESIMESRIASDEETVGVDGKLDSEPIQRESETSSEERSSIDSTGNHQTTSENLE